MKREACISLILNLRDLMAIEPESRTDNQARAVVKMKCRLRDAYNARNREAKWWDRDVVQNTERRRVLEVCIAHKGRDADVDRRNQARREARLAEQQ